MLGASSITVASTEGFPTKGWLSLNGDAVYYNANLWHRGWNPAGINRWTMHAAFWSVAYPLMKHEYGQREAMLQPGYLEQMPPITTNYIRRYLEQYPEGEPQPLFDL